MAATLIHIKSRMLVPRVEAGLESDEAEEDPREALVQRLLEHQRFKAAAEMLHECETVRSAQWTRPDQRVEAIAGAPFERELEVDLFSLLQAFQAVLTRARNRQSLHSPAGGRRVGRDPHAGDARAAGRRRSLRVRGAVRGYRVVPAGDHRDVSRYAGTDRWTRLIRVLQARVCGLPIRVYLSGRIGGSARPSRCAAAGTRAMTAGRSRAP